MHTTYNVAMNIQRWNDRIVAIKRQGEKNTHSCRQQTKLQEKDKDEKNIQRCKEQTKLQGTDTDANNI